MLQLQEEDWGAKEWRREGPEKLKKPKVRECQKTGGWWVRGTDSRKGLMGDTEHAHVFPGTVRKRP